MDSKNMLTVRQTAELLGVSQWAVRQMIRRRQLRAEHFGWMVLLRRTDVETLKRERDTAA